MTFTALQQNTQQKQRKKYLHWFVIFKVVTWHYCFRTMVSWVSWERVVWQSSSYHSEQEAESGRRMGSSTRYILLGHPLGKTSLLQINPPPKCHIMRHMQDIVEILKDFVTTDFLINLLLVLGVTNLPLWHCMHFKSSCLYFIPHTIYFGLAY